MTPSENLWGDLPEVQDERTPLTILKEQGERLKGLSKGILFGEITAGGLSTARFTYEFSIVAPLIGNYRYRLLGVQWELDFYPLEIVFYTTDMRYKCLKEEDFIEKLREIFTDKKTKDTIQKLLTHSRASRGINAAL
jgi:hypothetical protein